MIYLDSNATTAISKKALEEMNKIYEVGCVNPSSIHIGGKLAKKHLEQAKDRILHSLNASGYDLIFTSSGTEANNLALNSKKIITTGVEHESIKNQTPVKTVTSVDRDGCINFMEFQNFAEQGGCASIIWANNQTGVVQNMKKILEIKGSCFLHTDAVQYAGKRLINLAETPVDAITISSHKIHGPHGVGCLVFKKDFPIEKMIFGGSQENSLRAGTYNLPGIIGFSFALMEVNSVEYIEKYVNHTQKLTNFISAFVLKNGGKIIAQNSDKLSNTLCIVKKGVLTTEQLLIMDINGICISAGSACSAGVVSKSYVLQEMGIDGEEISCAIRVSVDISNTFEDVQEFCKVWKAL